MIGINRKCTLNRNFSCIGSRLLRLRKSVMPSNQHVITKLRSQTLSQLTPQNLRLVVATRSQSRFMHRHRQNQIGFGSIHRFHIEYLSQHISQRSHIIEFERPHCRSNWRFVEERSVQSIERGTFNHTTRTSARLR